MEVYVRHREIRTCSGSGVGSGHVERHILGAALKHRLQTVPLRVASIVIQLISAASLVLVYNEVSRTLSASTCLQSVSGAAKQHPTVSRSSSGFELKPHTIAAQQLITLVSIVILTYAPEIIANVWRPTRTILSTDATKAPSASCRRTTG